MINYQLCANAWGKLIKRSLITENNLEFKSILSEDVLFHIPLLYLADKYIILSDSSYYYRKVSTSITNGSNIEKSKKAITAILQGLKYLEEYINMMPEIHSDKELVAMIRRFFADSLFRGLFLRVSNGLNVNDVVKNGVKVFNEEVPEQAGLLTILFENYFRQANVQRK